MAKMVRPSKEQRADYCKSKRAIRRRQSPYPIVKELGFKSYRADLFSDLWKSIRARVLSKNDKCIRCKKPADHVYHHQYTMKNLSGKSLKGLYPVCAECHRLAHRRRWC